MIKEILIQHKASYFKVVRKGVKMSTDPDQRGKDVTVYAYEDINIKPEQWFTIMKEITLALTKAHIPSGYRPPIENKTEEKPLNGSNYVCYRYENPNYITHDPFENMSMQIPEQLAIATWTLAETTSSLTPR